MVGRLTKYGRVGTLSHFLFHSFHILFLMALVHSKISFAQTHSLHNIQSQQDFISVLLKLNSSQIKDAESLLDLNAYYVTINLWNILIDKADKAYYFNSPERSLEIYQIAIYVAERLKNKKYLATTYYHIGRVYYGMDKARDAIKKYLFSKKIFEEAGLHRDLVYILSGLGSFHLSLKDYEQARKYSQQSIDLAQILRNRDVPAGAWPDSFGVANALLTLGELKEYEGNYNLAMDYFQRSLKIYNELNKASMRYNFQIVVSMTSIGRIYYEIGNNIQALINLNQALEMSRRLGYVNITASVLNNLGILYLEQEDYEKATHYFFQSLQIYQKLKNRSDFAKVFLNLAVVHQRRGEYNKALESFEFSLQRASEVLNKAVIIAAKQGIGAIYRVQGKYQAALQVLDSGLSMAKELDDKIRIAEVLWRKAEVFYAMGDYDQTAILAEESFNLAQQLRQSNLSCYAATLLGKAQLKQKKTDLAFQTLSKAIDQIEVMRDRIAGQEQELQLYFENKVDSYHTLVESLVEENRPFDALLYSERAKGRVLFDVIRKGRIDITKSMTEKEKEEERRLNHLIVSLNNQIRNEQSKQSTDALRVNEIKEQLDSARLEYSSFQNLLFASHPKLKAQRGEVPVLNLDALLSLNQSSQTAFLAYQVTRERVYLFVLSRNDQRPVMELKVFTIPVKEEDMGKRVRILHDMIAGHRLTFTALSREIYDLLIKPAEQLIQGKTILCVIPDGILWDVPFQALMPQAGRYLTEDYSIHYAPSLSVLVEMTRRKAPGSTPDPGSLLALGNPFVGSQTVRQLQEQQRGDAFEPLPAAEIEVNKLADIFSRKRSKIFTGTQAEERVFKSLSPAFNTIHLATHGILDNRHPLYSYLLLSKRDDDPNEDGLLEAREIMNLDLRADLAVLSACETARGKIGSGEGVIGMSWAFFVAGCRTTVVSQWKVNSAGTSVLMINFYKLLEESNADNRRTKAGALRLAALNLMKDRRYQHPYYWAGFVLIGSNE